jgi:hypothetical protein
MTSQRDTPFETLESAYEFVCLLREAVDEEYGAILEEIARAQSTPGAERRVDALRLVDHKLNGLRRSLIASLLQLNDLRTLRRLLLGERQSVGDEQPG